MGIKETEAALAADPEAMARIEHLVEDNYRSVALAELRGGRVTQHDVGQVLGVSQRRVSAIERAEDLQVSTLRSYLSCLGLELKLVALDAEGRETPIALAG